MQLENCYFLSQDDHLPFVAFIYHHVIFVAFLLFYYVMWKVLYVSNIEATFEFIVHA